VCVLNFIVYLAGTIVLGGDALNHGSVSNGHFYVQSHGRTKEVTEGLFEYSRWQASTLKITQPVFVAAFSALSSSGSMPRSLGVRDDRSSHNPPEFFAVSNAHPQPPLIRYRG